MYRGKVTKVDAKGVYVQTADFGVIGPCQAVVANYAVGDMVLLSDVGSDAMPDLVVVGRLTGTGSAVPGASTDNAVARFDGTGGALQNSGVTITDGKGIQVTGATDPMMFRSTASMDVFVYAGAPGENAAIFLRTAGNKRWFVGKEASAESGSNAGSNFRIWRYNDDGSSIGQVFGIDRATGRVTIDSVGSTAGIELGSGGPTITSGTGAPTHSAPNGSTYHRTDGTASTTLYVRAAGAWSALS